MRLRVQQNWGYIFPGPHNKGCGILGSILGCPVCENYHVGLKVPKTIQVIVLGNQCQRHPLGTWTLRVTPLNAGGH